MERQKETAFAKINLGLDVLAERPDGYHEVAMIMQTVGICDELEFTVTEPPGIRLRVEPADGGERSTVAGIPDGPANLVWRAAELLMEEAGIKSGLDILLRKRIPAAAGMAGGSSDCAAALRAVNRLFALGLSDRELAERGVRLGADVPYCLTGGTALAEGIGERLTPLPPMPDCSLVIAKPEIGIPTPLIYRNLRLDRLEKHPDIAGMRKAVERGDLDGIAARLGNVLETAAIPLFPEVGRLKRAMTGHGEKGVLMSGSGPTVFAVYAEEETARKAADILRESGFSGQIFVTEPVSGKREGTDGE